jgi:hypothetical protein
MSESAQKQEHVGGAFVGNILSQRGLRGGVI